MNRAALSNGLSGGWGHTRHRSGGHRIACFFARLDGLQTKFRDGTTNIGLWLIDESCRDLNVRRRNRVREGDRAASLQSARGAHREDRVLRGVGVFTALGSAIEAQLVQFRQGIFKLHADELARRDGD